MRTNPHILEINAAVWLDCLSAQEGHAVHFGNIPEQQLEGIELLGFDAVWLMGVWKRSPKSSEIARSNQEILRAVSNAYPEYDRSKISASPYAVYEYTVEPAFGNEHTLLDLKRRLNEKGIALFLDFVGNHFAVDHPKILENPDLFINTGKEPPQETRNGFTKQTTAIISPTAETPTLRHGQIPPS
ncbi:glycosidase [Elusimicrobium posterum]|uniref:alpha-amylase family glycosyl hydrolase n=1 Tax=Elusimicrobium posterum TaxID=3116653 RepID=UPI003C771428